MDTIKAYAQSQGVYAITFNGDFAGRIINKGGNWTFRASSSPDGVLDGKGPLLNAEGIDVTHAIYHPEKLTKALELADSTSE